MMKIVGLLLLLSAMNTWALVPVEGIILGEAQEDIQTDPLERIFSDIYDKTQFGENKKIKLYQNTYNSGQNLVESCGYLEAPAYTFPWQEKQAKRSVAATLQYIGLDASIKAVGAYARKLDVTEDQYKKLTENLVKNYCSKNVTIFSLRNIRSSLDFYYKNPLNEIIPSVVTSPFATQMMKDKTETPEARSRQFDHVIKNFRAFCSWGGETEDYRLMTPYLNNRFIMSFVMKNMLGMQDQVDPKSHVVTPVADTKNTVQVVCSELICRKEDDVTFRKKFPASTGSTGIQTDLAKLYCHHFRFQDAPQKTLPEVKAWIKAQELEDPILETSQFLSVMTGVPDMFSGIDNYRDIPLLVRSSVDERWNKWARDVLNSFSKDLLYEESLKVRVEPRRDRLALASDGFKIDFSITLGEMDRLMQENDKLGLTFDLALSKNYLRSLRAKWNALEKEVDEEGKKEFKEEMARYLTIQLREKQKYFTQKIWNDDFGKIIAEELLGQVLMYQGPMFNSYEETMLKVPVKFSYGLFAISYLRYRADVARGQTKHNL